MSYPIQPLLKLLAAALRMIGARTLEQFHDNFGCLDFQLDATQVAWLDEASPIELGYPHDFLTRTRPLVFGGFQKNLDVK